MMRFSGRNTTDKLDFVARQLTSLMEAHSAEAALAKVAEACSPDFAEEVDAFRALFEDPEPSRTALSDSSFQTLSALMSTAPGPSAALFREYNEYLQRSQVVFRTYWAGVSGLIAYLGVISIIAVWLGALFVVFLLPPLGALYESNDATLPALTRTFFRFGDIGLPVFGILLIAGMGTLFWFALRFRHRFRKLAPLPRWPAWVPVFGSVARTYNLGLFLNFTRMLRRCDVPADQAITAAGAVSNQANDLSLDVLIRDASEPGADDELIQLGIAAKLGTFDSELTHQCEQHVGTLTRALVAGRERLALVLKLFIYAVIAAVVIAMYLPIFNMAVLI